MNILVLCTGNSARSILLECLLNQFGDGRLRAYSAGSKPAGSVHPQALAHLRSKGVDVTGLRSKNWAEFGTPYAQEMDIVITVCGSAAAEVCPIWPGTPLRTHWGIDDPAAAAEPDWPQAFDLAYEKLEIRAQAFLALPIKTMSRNELQAALNKIGKS